MNQNMTVPLCQYIEAEIKWTFADHIMKGIFWNENYHLNTIEIVSNASIDKTITLV